MDFMSFFVQLEGKYKQTIIVKISEDSYMRRTDHWLLAAQAVRVTVVSVQGLTRKFTKTA